MLMVWCRFGYASRGTGMLMGKPLEGPARIWPDALFQGHAGEPEFPGFFRKDDMNTAAVHLDPEQQAQIARERQERLVLDHIERMKDAPVMLLLEDLRKKFALTPRQIGEYLALWIGPEPKVTKGEAA